MKKLFSHLSNWSEAYLVLPITILSVIGAALYEHFLTGRAVKDSVDWLTDYSSVSIKAALIIVFTAAYKQSTGSWMTLEQKLANPWFAMIGDVKVVISTLIFAYLFTH